MSEPEQPSPATSAPRGDAEREPHVERVRQLLDGMTDQSLAAQVDALEQVHGTLVAALDDLRTRTDGTAS